jgi:ERCC4-related helicase
VEPDWPPSFAALQLIYQEYDLKNDPYVLSLLERHRQGLDCTRTLEKVLSNRKTYCLEQLKRIVVKGNAMTQELGRSPTEWYLQQCIRTFQKIKQSLEPLALDWSLQERQHLSKIFQSLPGLDKEAQHKISLEALSSKVERLIDVLVSEASPGFTGLVFVEQRAWVAALSEILAIHPRTKDLFTVGTFVGTSNSAKRKPNIADLAEPRNQQDTLDDFRAGRINLILATSVLEEGIDVSSCHLVICFERPKNLKSFIQRRGRARMPKSKYIIFLPASDSNTHSPGVWESLEEQMKQEYLNDLREIEKARQRELEDEEGVLYYRVETTG